MALFLRRLVVILVSSLCGLLYARYVHPFITLDFLGAHMPIGETFLSLETFGHYAFIRPLLVWAAAVFASFVALSPARCVYIVRVGILTLPFTAPFLYAVIFLVVSFKA